MHQFLFTFFPERFQLGGIGRIQVQLRNNRIISLQGFKHQDQLSVGVGFLRQVDHVALLLPFFKYDGPLHFVAVSHDTLFPPVVSQIDHLHPVIGLYIHLIESIDDRPAEITGFRLFASRERIRQCIVIPFDQESLCIRYSAVVRSHPPHLLVLGLQAKAQKEHKPGIEQLVFT